MIEPFPRGRPVKYRWSESAIGDTLRVPLNGQSLASQKAALYASAKNAGYKISVSSIMEVGFIHAKIISRKEK